MNHTEQQVIDMIEEYDTILADYIEYDGKITHATPLHWFCQKQADLIAVMRHQIEILKLDGKCWNAEQHKTT